MREKYESLSLATLKELAKARGLKGISALRKPELIERMLEEDEQQREKEENSRKEKPESRMEGKQETRQETRFPERHPDRVQEPAHAQRVQETSTMFRQKLFSLTAEKRRMVFWRCFRMDMDLSDAKIICPVKTIFMYRLLRSADLI